MLFDFAELASHPDVLEVSVVAREHPKWGERPMAFVILHVESAKRWADKLVEFAVELKAHARERLPGFALPEWVAVVEELPVRSRHIYDFRASTSQQRDFALPENVHREDPKSGLAKTSCKAVTVVAAVQSNRIYIIEANGSSLVNVSLHINQNVSRG